MKLYSISTDLTRKIPPSFTSVLPTQLSIATNAITTSTVISFTPEMSSKITQPPKTETGNYETSETTTYSSTIEYSTGRYFAKILEPNTDMF